MPRHSSTYVSLVIGAVMIALGLYVALHLAVTGGRTVTGTLFLDLAFAFFFVARGALQIARVRKQNRT